MSKALKGVPGVTEANVEVGSATVTCEPTLDVGLLKAAIEDAGYDVASITP